MLKALNLYELLKVPETPFIKIKIGQTAEQTKILCKSPQGLRWIPFPQIRLESHDRMFLTEYFLKEIGPKVIKGIKIKGNQDKLTWKPEESTSGSIRRWISPYLRVSDEGELEELLQEDLKTLAEAKLSTDSQSKTS